MPVDDPPNRPHYARSVVLVGGASSPECLRTVHATMRAATVGSSCSQKRKTVQPSSRRRRSVSRSRATFSASLTRHHDRFRTGVVPCSGQECQKQPSTKMTTRCRVNTISPRRRVPSKRRSTRYRRPAANSRRRRAISGPVFALRCLRIRRAVSASLAAGLLKNLARLRRTRPLPTRQSA